VLAVLSYLAATLSYDLDLVVFGIDIDGLFVEFSALGSREDLHDIVADHMGRLDLAERGFVAVITA
jgi:DNA helicase HerA-like ATPase